MPLTQPTPPERVCLPARQYTFSNQPLDRKQTRIPPHRNYRSLTRRFCRRIYSLKILRDLGMRIETIDRIKQRRQLRSLLRQIVSGAATQDQNINPCAKLHQLLHRIHTRLLKNRRQLIRRTPRKNADQFHITVKLNCAFNTLAKIAVPNDSYSSSTVHLRLFFPSLHDSSCSS